VCALCARPIDGDPAPALPQIGKREANFVFLHEIPRMILLQGPYRARARLGSRAGGAFRELARTGGGGSLLERVSAHERPLLKGIYGNFSGVRRPARSIFHQILL
jgi:hypothetical protein